jgi:hypothetical protein
MRRLTAWIGGVASGVVAYRFWRRHTQAAPAGPPPPAPPTPAPDDRADELRAKLAETRTAEPVVEETPPEPVADEEPAVKPESPENRRQRVHEEGRATLDEMKSDDGGVAPS